MIIPFEISGVVINLQPYNTFKEKEILLLSSHGLHDFNSVFNILGIDVPESLSIDEQKIVLYKLREISVGDEVDVKFVCEKCGTPNEVTLDAKDFLKVSKRNDDDIKKLNITVTDDNLSKFVEIDVDELDIEDYEILKQRVTDNQDVISFMKDCDCFKCRAKKTFDLGSSKYIVEIMSDDTLMTLYRSYNYLTFFGDYTKQDVDSMYPFERSIFIGLLSASKEDMAK